MDLTNKLPNEIWIEILDRLPSLKDQLRVENVSKRFRSCILKLFEIKPLTLVIGSNNSTTGNYGSLNKSRFRRPDQLLDAVRMLADKAKLRSIKSTCSRLMPLWTTLDLSFSALINSKNQCLDKMTEFELTDFKASRSLLLELVTKCTKLSSFKLGDHIYVRPESNLTSALIGKALTRLEISLGGFEHLQLIDLLQSLEPDTLKNIRLSCERMTLEPVALIDELRINAWAALEELELKFEWVEVQLSDLFDSLSRLPKLHKCSIELVDIQPHEQFVSALTSLFSSPIETRMVSHCGSNMMEDFSTGCQFVNATRQVLQHHPMLEIEFEIYIRPVSKMSLGPVSFVDRLPYVQPCNNNCIDCGSFYPTLLNKLNWMANAQVDAHVEAGSLYRCKIDKVVDDLNRVSQGLQYRALAIENNDNLATIRFLSKTSDHQFNITVVGGRCLSNRCTKCTQVE